MSLEQHVGALLAAVRPLQPLDVPLVQAIGCQLVGDVTAPRPIPHFPTAALGGYAVRSADVTGSVKLRVIDDVAPGFAAGQQVRAGTAVRVAAGTAIPRGADAVVPGPAVAVGQPVTISGTVTTGAGVIVPGSIAAAGELLLRSGRVVDAAAVGLLATLGIVRVPVRPSPRVVVVSVGDDLVDLGTTPTPGLLFDAAGPMLAAAAEAAGAIAYRVGPVPLIQAGVGDAIDDQLIRADLVVVIGPTADPRLRAELARLGAIGYDDGHTWPGPFGHGTLGDERVTVVVLPADPVAAAMLFAVLAAPTITAMRGLPVTAPQPMRLASPVARHPDADRLILAATDAPGSVRALEASGMLALIHADHLVLIPPGTGRQPADSVVATLRLRR